MKYYRKKPVVIAAWQLTRENMDEVAAWCGGLSYGGGDGAYIAIQTLEGVMTAGVGDFVVRGVKGEFYPCKPDIFVETNEAADPPGKQTVGIRTVRDKNGLDSREWLVRQMRRLQQELEADSRSAFWMRPRDMKMICDATLALLTDEPVASWLTVEAEGADAK